MFVIVTIHSQSSPHAKLLDPDAEQWRGDGNPNRQLSHFGPFRTNKFYIHSLFQLNSSELWTPIATWAKYSVAVLTVVWMIYFALTSCKTVLVRKPYKEQK